MPLLSIYIPKLTMLLASLRARLYPGDIPQHRKFVAIALLLAVGLFIHLNDQLSTLSKERNEAEVAALATTISSRMEAYEEIVTGAAAFYGVMGQVSRQSWKKYIDRLTLDEFLPGIQGLGFNQLVSANEKAAHERKIRAEGFPDYSIRPKGERDEYTPVVFIEPYSGRNLRALGYDTYSDEARRRAMLIAKETKQLALTDMILLVQETGKAIQHGYVMYFPVHRIKDIVTGDTVEASELIGWVSAPFRVDDLLKTVVGGHRFQNIAFELYDSAMLGKPIYTHAPTGLAFKAVSGQETRSEVPVANRRWLLHAKHVDASSGGLGGMDTFIKWFLAVAFLSSLLLLFLRGSATPRKNDVDEDRAQDSSFPLQESGPDSTNDTAAAAVASLDALLTRLGLTVRQKEVMHMLIAGASNKVICRELDLSEATVKVHVSAILKALHVQSRYQLTTALKDLDQP
jgi:CHASE1-domain containing sensor protein/DNA-binding CsgD family transcriptional regulator